VPWTVLYVTVVYVPDAIGAEVHGVESSLDCRVCAFDCLICVVCMPFPVLSLTALHVTIVYVAVFYVPDAISAEVRGVESILHCRGCTLDCLTCVLYVSLTVLSLTALHVTVLHVTVFYSPMTSARMYAGLNLASTVVYVPSTVLHVSYMCH
jgi:hypothetical protein